MRRIPSILGASNHIHRNIPNDAFMDLEIIKQHLPELLDLRELLLHLDYEDSEPVSEGKCLLKEETESFIPIYVKPKLSYSDGVPQEIKDSYENISLETWGNYFYLNYTQPFNRDSCGLKPIVSGEYICLPLPLSQFLANNGETFYVDNPNGNYMKVESTQETSSSGNTGTVQHYTCSNPGSSGSLYAIEDNGGYGEVASIRNKFELYLSVGVESTVQERWADGYYIPTVKRTFIDFTLGYINPVGLDLTPVTFTKLVRNEE